MRPGETTNTKNSAIDGVAMANESQRRLVSGLLVAAIAFLLAYVFFAATFDRWGTTIGWMPSSAIAAAFGWIGHCFPWIGDVITVLIDLLSLLMMFF